MEASMVSRMKELEEENRRLKKMYAELSLTLRIPAIVNSDSTRW